MTTGQSDANSATPLAQNASHLEVAPTLSGRRIRGQRRPFLRCPSVLAVAGVVAAALMAGCGSAPPEPVSSNAVTVDGRSATPGLPASSSPPLTPSTAASQAPTIPTTSYIAVCDATSVTFYDQSSGQVLASITGLRLDAPTLSGSIDSGGAFGSFVPTGAPDPDVLGSTFNCANLSFDGSMTKIAGLDSYPEGDTVPATYDLLKAHVHGATDAVAATGYPSGGFTPPQTKSYVAAAFDPTGSALWFVKTEGRDNAYPDGYTLIGPSGQKRSYRTDGVQAQGVIQFVFGNPVPTFVDDSPSSQLSPDDPEITSDAQAFFISDIDLPSTDYSVRLIRRPDSGRPGGAFLATRDGVTTLFRWDGSSTPTKVVDIPTATIDSQVVRWNDAR